MTRKTGFRLAFSALHRKPSKDNERTLIGEIILIKGYTPVFKVKFWIDETCIYISDFDAHVQHKHCGYGSLTMDYMKFLAEVLQKPILLYSIDSAVKFYEKNGMEHLDSQKMRNKVGILNENPKCKHEWSDTDFIWIPQCLSHKKIWVYG